MRKQNTYFISEFCEKLKLTISELFIESEGKEYEACHLKIDESNVLARKAKITPTKNGQFVTCWRRNDKMITEPFSEDAIIDFLVVYVELELEKGVFVFDKETLIKNGIFSRKEIGGKRGFRVYPAWDVAESKQAISTQKWQLNSFYNMNQESDLIRLRELFL